MHIHDAAGANKICFPLLRGSVILLGASLCIFLGFLLGSDICLKNSTLIQTEILSATKLMSLENIRRQSSYQGSDSNSTVEGRQALSAIKQTSLNQIHVPKRFPIHRDFIGKWLNEAGYKTGLEIGVQRGGFALTTLRSWTKCERYHMIDMWEQQSNYVEVANVDDKQHEKFLLDARQALKPLANRTKLFFHITRSDVAANLFENESLDYIYVDARHDYCGVKADIELYWPKVRPGGLFAGHDYYTAAEVLKRDASSHWEVCEDGSTHPGAVKGAVQQFASVRNLSVHETREGRIYHSWMIYKPIESVVQAV